MGSGQTEMMRGLGALGGNCILFFVKYPEKGMVKSRLAKKLGEKMTAELYRKFVLDILSVLKEIRVDHRICFFPEDYHGKFMEWLGASYSYIPQDGTDLGERMKNSLSRVFSESVRKAVVIGSDSPDLPGDIISLGLSSLRTYDAVIGPSHDGGYYLIGFRKESFLPDIFRDISWSSGTVYRDTMDILGKAGLKTFILPEWRDIDTISDLRDLVQRNEDMSFKSSNTLVFLSSHKNLLKITEARGGTASYRSPV